jgi:hypothetical protein
VQTGEEFLGLESGVCRVDLQHRLARLPRGVAEGAMQRSERLPAGDHGVSHQIEVQIELQRQQCLVLRRATSGRDSQRHIELFQHSRTLGVT